jgi:hypothetical protein
MAGNGVETAGKIAPCEVCGKPGYSGRGALCEEHYEAWRLAKESIRFNEHNEAGRKDAARVAFEDFVRRVRAEVLNRAA